MRDTDPLQSNSPGTDEIRTGYSGQRVCRPELVTGDYSVHASLWGRKPHDFSAPEGPSKSSVLRHSGQGEKHYFVVNSRT